MFRRLQLSLASLLVLFTSGSAMAVAADSTDVQTGLGNMGPALFIFAIAAALLLTLVFRSTVSHLARVITGKIGARRIHGVLSARSKDVLDDFLLPGAYGGLTRIDHAILTSGGILCIQTKHYNGIIFGDADEPQWTNVDGIHRRKFLNPLIQNEGRTRALQKAAPDVPVANLVVFTGDVQFTSATEKNVIHVRDLDVYIAKFVFGPCKIEDWDAVWMTVKSAALTDEESRKDFSAQLSFS
jgi:ABC-type multidrug transport system fused ATPase/permease subunit